MRAPHHPHRAGGAILLVVGVEDEEQVQRAHRHRVGAVGLGRHREHHVEEVRAVVEIVARVDEGVPDALLVGERGEGGQLAHQARDGDVPIFVGLRVERVRIVGRERGHHGGEDRHRVRRHRVAVEEPAHVLVDHGMAGEEPRELLQLRSIRQAPVDEQVGRLDEAAPLAQLLDGDSAVAQDPLLTVEERDRALRGGRVHERGIERHHAGLRAQVLDVDPFLALGAGDHRELEVLAVHGDASVLSHGRLPPHAARAPLSPAAAKESRPAPEVSRRFGRRARKNAAQRLTAPAFLHSCARSSAATSSGVSAT